MPGTTSLVVIAILLASSVPMKTGLGFARVTASTTTGNTTVTTTENGFGTTFGVGYDIKVGRNVYLTPNFDTLVQVISGATKTVFLLTLGLTWP